MTRLKTTMSQRRSISTCTEGPRAIILKTTSVQLPWRLYYFSERKPFWKGCWLPSSLPGFPEYTVQNCETPIFAKAMCLEQGFSNFICTRIARGLLKQIAGHWGEAQSICFSNKFPDSAEACWAGNHTWEPLATGSSHVRSLPEVLFSFLFMRWIETGGSLPHHAHPESYK